jgi:fructose/tagatose bisphosphate aldolase
MLLTPPQARALLETAVAQKFAILAVNADSHAAVTDCLEAARECDAPIIIETSLWQLTGRGFGAGDPILGLARYLADLAALAESERYREVPAIFHTDHIKGPDTIRILSAAIRGVPQRVRPSRSIPPR